ncbi:hypothetical protein N8D56_23575 [Devosia sp. A8/3-2]|nr:hypothetical protein N8D56_23575 [Devosia sp. A8/3-2]
MEWMDNSFWATVGLVLFPALITYFGVPRVIGKMLDKRIQQIVDELEAAKKLREEAAALLVEYEQKRVAAESEAEGIIAAAKEEAVRLTAEARASLADWSPAAPAPWKPRSPGPRPGPLPKCAPALPMSPSKRPAPC